MLSSKYDFWCNFNLFEPKFHRVWPSLRVGDVIYGLIEGEVASVVRQDKITDGPFIELKEIVGGYMPLSATSTQTQGF
jgi:hypothetical protein